MCDGTVRLSACQASKWEQGWERGYKELQELVTTVVKRLAHGSKGALEGVLPMGPCDIPAPGYTLSISHLLKLRTPSDLLDPPRVQDTE